MPPNRKGTFETVDSLATLNVAAFVTTSKYQPLTSLASPPSPADTKIEEAADAQIESRDGYVAESHQLGALDWIVEQERLRQLFSVDHVVETMLKGAELKPAITATRQAAKDVASNYWDEESPENQSELRAVHVVKSNHVDQDYWTWSEGPSKQEEKDALIRKILIEEKNRELLSVATIEKQIQKEAFHLVDSKPVSSNNAEAEDYWAWETRPETVCGEDSDTLTPEEKDALIQKILRDEKIREQLSVATIEEQLTRSQESLAETIIVGNAASDDYWANF